MLTCPIGTVVNDGEPLSEGFVKWRTPTLFEPNVRDTITITITNLFFFDREREDARARLARFSTAVERLMT